MDVLTTGLLGLLTAAVVAIHLSLTAQPPEPVLVPSMDNPGAEFFRIIDREQLRGT